MKVICNNQVEGRMEVLGIFTNDSQVVTINGDNPPNPPEEQLIGKDFKLFLDTTSNKLVWVPIDRALTPQEELQKRINDLETLLLTYQGVI